jgi:hypothetical protein
MSLRAESVVRLLNQLRLQPISGLSLAYYVPALTLQCYSSVVGQMRATNAFNGRSPFFSYLPSIEYFIIELDFLTNFPIL